MRSTIVRRAGLSTWGWFWSVAVCLGSNFGCNDFSGLPVLFGDEFVLYCCFQVKWVPVLIWICSPPAFAFLSCETSEFFPGAQGTPFLTSSWLWLLYSITRDVDIYDGQIAIGLTNSLWHICYLIPCRSRISGVSLFLWISSRWYSLSIFAVSSVISECCTI